MKDHKSLRALQPLHDLVQDAYLGNYRYIGEKISSAIYMLHYLPPEDFAKEDIKEVVFVLEQLRKSFDRAQGAGSQKEG